MHSLCYNNIILESYKKYNININYFISFSLLVEWISERTFFIEQLEKKDIVLVFIDFIGFLNSSMLREILEMVENIHIFILKNIKNLS